MAITAPDPIPSFREQPTANETTFGGGPGIAQEGQEIQKVAQAAGEIGALHRVQEDWEVQRANETAVQGATAKLSAVHTDLLTNPNSGLPAYRGINAMTGQDKLWQQYQKSANGIAETLVSPEQRLAFNKVALSSGNNFREQINAHVHQELERHDSNTFDALVLNKAEESGKTYGNAKALAFNNQLVDEATEARAARLGLDPQETKKFQRAVKTTYHENVLSQMVNDPNFMKQAKQYFATYQGEMDMESRDRVKQLFDTVPKQQEAANKAAQEQYFKANMRTAMLDMFDGNLTLSEVQRRFRENQLDKSDYNLLAGQLSKPDAAVMQSFLVSDPETFNQIRQAQLTGSASPGEIQRMIANGAASKDITPDDGKYLLGINSEKPPTPRDRDTDAQAGVLRDFGNRYFAETNFLGMEKNKQKSNQAAEALVNDFYVQADKTKASGEDLVKLRDQVLKTYAAKRYPGIGKLEKMPDVVIDIKGHVVRLLSPDQRSALKPKYKITPAGSGDKEDK